MSWIQDLYETYNNCQSMIGIESNGNEVPLLPICHTTQKAQIEVVIDGNGNFRRARVIPKDEARTIIPCTEDSGGRTSGEAPHPLCDKLQYVAIDYSEHGGSKKPYFASYISSLEKWCDSNFSDPKIIAVLGYVKKGNVIGDLISHRILLVSEDGKLLKKWEKKKGEVTPQIFEVLTSQEDAFVRWAVEIPEELESRVWWDKILWDKWILYYISTRDEKSLCYVTGKEELTAKQHLAKLINDGDKAKIISSNDTAGFTFLGRFLTANQATAVGLETTQKAHLALRWLISRQGYRKDGLAIVSWATSGLPIPSPTGDTLSVIGFDDVPSSDVLGVNTAQESAIKFKKKIAGYGAELGNITKVVTMGLDSATPGQGRMAIIYYRKLEGSDFLQRINEWHNSCAWLHRYRTVEMIDKNGKSKKKYTAFIGAPSPRDIAEAAYGSRLDGNLQKATITRLLPCIIDGQPIPRDLVESVIRRASNRVGIRNPDDKKYYGDEEYTWKKTLSIACALFRKYNRKENYSMALDLNRKTRDYLYGRLLALAESLEEWALNKAGEDRPTNAARLMQRFSEHPFSTWRTIELALTPYKARLGGKSKKRQRMIDDVVAAFTPEDFTSDKKLSGEFLLGYHSQREDLRNSIEVNKDTDEEESNNQ
jgi:CRISPR-associated protein Csd1